MSEVDLLAGGPRIEPGDPDGYIVTDDTARIAAIGATPAEAWESYRESIRQSRSLRGGYWPEHESAEDFDATVRAWRDGS